MKTSETGTLYVVATPIGNLEDMTYRAVRILGEVDLILCEDTRTSKTLLRHYGIDAKTSSYHAHSNTHKHDSIVALLLEGKSIALISDAGTPGISDPGSLLISAIREEHPDIPVIPIPGVNAIGALVSVSGFTGNEFTFLGFVPHKKGRETFFATLLEYEHPVVFYESCHRILKTLDALVRYEDTHVLFVGREMTKKFETYSYGSITSVQARIGQNSNTQKGEFSIMLIPQKK
jgi:16S rRNA (cytidine1402-2'-O)-methyltransferase